MKTNSNNLKIKIYAILCIILFLIVGAYSFFNGKSFLSIRDGVDSNQQTAAIIKSDLSDVKDVYDANKEDFEELSSTIQKRIVDIFPDSDNYTELTRQLDVFEKKLSSKSNTFEISNINYQSPIVTETYSALPFRMNIQCSSSNFSRFLHLIENSGSLDEDIRLMEISSIKLNFDNSGRRDKLINFTVQIKAYFQKITE